MQEATMKPNLRVMIGLLATSMVVGCGDDSSGTDGGTTDTGVATDTSVTDMSALDASNIDAGECEGLSPGLNPDHFTSGSLAEEITVEDCTLANGEETTCYRVVIAGEPSNHELTSVCPRTIEDAAAGYWMIDGEAAAVDGPFIMSLPELFDDPAWQMYDPETGEVYVTNTSEDCLAAGGMPLDPNYSNYCLEYLIPTDPVLAATPTELAQLAPGMSINGVQFEFPADIATIESGLQIAPIDFCGGHTNFNIGYHYHEDHGCIEGVAQCDDHAALIGYARDGFGIYEMANEAGVEPADLDECRGHTDAIRGYHYHALGAGENAIIGCLSGELVEGAGGGGPGGPPGGGPGEGPPGE